MYLPIPIWLVYLFLCIASFSPIASYWPGWWKAYYGALLTCWVVASVAAMRRVAHQERRTKRRFLRQLLEDRAAETEPAEADTDAAVRRLRLAPTSTVGHGTKT
jgi:hypothetical protein